MHANLLGQLVNLYRVPILSIGIVPDSILELGRADRNRVNVVGDLEVRSFLVNMHMHARIQGKDQGSVGAVKDQITAS